jgi:hypothetical protein
MAIQIVFEDGAGVLHSEAYARVDRAFIDNPANGKPSLSADISIYANKDKRDADKNPVWGPQGFTFPINDVTGVTVATAYGLIKQLDLFKDGKDV